MTQAALFCSVANCSRPVVARNLCASHYVSPRTCAEDGCNLPVAAHDLCRRHYVPPFKPCSISGCGNRLLAKGLCRNHYMQERRQTDEYRAWKREYNRRASTRASENERLRQRYASDPDYRAKVRQAQSGRYRKAPGLKRRPSTLWRDVERLRRRHRGECVYCGGEANSIDHVLPVAKGGGDTIGNLLPACQSCNSSKADLLLIEWKRACGMLLRSEVVLAFRNGVAAERTYSGETSGVVWDLATCHREAEASEPMFSKESA